MSRPRGYVGPEYLDLHARLLDASKERSYAFLHLQPGHRVLDVGCGSGTDTLALAALVGPTGLVVGVDYDQDMVAEAERRAAEAGVAARVQHRQADATALPFASDWFDACRSDRVFQHLPDPAGALAEMLRVTRPGGWVTVTDPDWGTLSIDLAETDLERRMTRFLVERCVNNGYSGRQLRRLFTRLRFEDITYRIGHLPLTDYRLARQVLVLDRVEAQALEAGVITRDELARWHASLEAAQREGVFFSCVSGVTVAGRKPATG